MLKIANKSNFILLNFFHFGFTKKIINAGAHYILKELKLFHEFYNGLPFLSLDRDLEELELELELLDEPLEDELLLLDDPLELLELSLFRSRSLRSRLSRSDLRSRSRSCLRSRSRLDDRSLSILRLVGEESRLELELRRPGIPL